MKWNVLTRGMTYTKWKYPEENGGTAKKAQGKRWYAICDICRQSPCHPMCPCCIPPQAVCHCSVCGGGIYEGEEYIENDNGDCRHYDCFTGTKEMLEWLGHKVMVMEENYQV